MLEESAMPDAAVFTTDVVRGVPVVHCSGEVDMTTAPAMGDAVDLLLDQRPPALVIDLGSVRFLSSAGLAVLVATAQTAGRAGVVLAVAAATRAVLRALEVSGVGTILTLCATVDEAVDRAALIPPTGAWPETQADPV
ncbi:MAG: STAS domain-containing protein [Umezawaea sp.]